MKLIVGLGNPGRKYSGTRHNVGFVVLAELARRHGTSKPRTDFQGEVVDAAIADVRTLLLCPHTLMNRSGASVRKAIDFYRVELPDLLVVCDDMNLPVGSLRVRAKGSSGGQRGLEDIIRHAGADEFARLRIGIGRPPDSWDPADYVLSKFNKAEVAEIDLAVVRAADAAADWVRVGVDACMNRYNGAVGSE
jgi:PTH1 family peptidyl-tRNA hydrolase